VNRQLADCRAEAERLRWTILDEYVDNDVSAFSGKKRPEYLRMLADIKAGRIDSVIVWHHDRLHRRPIELENFFQIIDKAGVASNIRAVTGNSDLGTGDGIFMARLLGAVAAKESEDKRRRIKRKNDEKAAAGLPVNSGRRPYGYTQDQMEIVDEEARIIRETAARRLAGESLYGLAAWLNEAGIPTAYGDGRRWSGVNVGRMLVRPRLAGLLTHRGEVVGEAKWPAILTREQHEALKMVNRNALRSPGAHRTARRYLLGTGILVCGRCGGRLVSHSGDKDRPHRYICPSRPDRGCGKLTITGPRIDNFIRDAILYRIDTPEFLKTLRERADVSRPAEPEQDLGAQLLAAESRRDNLSHLLGEGVLAAHDYAIAKRAVDGQIADLQAEIAARTNTLPLADLRQPGMTLLESWEALTLARKQATIKAVLHKVTILPTGRGQMFSGSRVDPDWIS
jgi:DNA invertase Pin-like site-specific DNA recombinase